MKRRPDAAKLILALAFAVGVGLALRQWVVGTVRVAGTSMRETLCSGDIAVVTRLDYRLGRIPARGDVVECRFPDRDDTYVKRVLGLPGEAVDCFGGALTVDGQALGESYVSSATGDFEIALGADQYLLLGDNRAESYDSRMADMGPVSAGDILGRVRWIIWPLSRFGPVR